MPQDNNIDLTGIKEPENLAQAPDSKTLNEEHDLDRQQKAAFVAGIWQDIRERKKYARHIFCLISIWLAGMFVLLLLQGFGRNSWFNLADGVLMAAIGGTTLNVIGIFVVVARYLFPQRADTKRS